MTKASNEFSKAWRKAKNAAFKINGSRTVIMAGKILIVASSHDEAHDIACDLVYKQCKGLSGFNVHVEEDGQDTGRGDGSMDFQFYFEADCDTMNEFKADMAIIGNDTRLCLCSIELCDIEESFDEDEIFARREAGK